VGRLVHPPGDVFPLHLAVAVLVEEEEGVDELVEDVVKLRRLELGDLKPPIALINPLMTASRSIDRLAMERSVFNSQAVDREDRSRRRKKLERARTRRVTSGPKSRYMRQRRTTNSWNWIPSRRSMSQ